MLFEASLGEVTVVSVCSMVTVTAVCCLIYIHAKLRLEVGEGRAASSGSSVARTCLGTWRMLTLSLDGSPRGSASRAARQALIAAQRAKGQQKAGRQS